MKKIVVITIVVLLVWLMAYFPHVMLNPGELVYGHQDLNNKCNSCHEPFFGISSERCISCHKLSEIGKDSINADKAILFHNKLKNNNCVSCHTDHKGKTPSISLNKFNHDFLSASDQSNCNNCHAEPMDNLHSQLSPACASCHNTGGWKLAVTFNHEMIQGANKNNCLSCHKKPDDSFHSSFENNCSECHSTYKWIPSTFNHSSYFILDQNHNAKCNTCHADNNFNSYTCYGCHEHSEGKIREEHSEEGISDFSNCVSCHRSGNEHDINYNKSGEMQGGENHSEKQEDDDD